MPLASTKLSFVNLLRIGRLFSVHGSLLIPGPPLIMRIKSVGSADIGVQFCLRQCHQLVGTASLTQLELFIVDTLFRYLIPEGGPTALN